MPYSPVPGFAGWNCGCGTSDPPTGVFSRVPAPIRNCLQVWARRARGFQGLRLQVSSASRGTVAAAREPKLQVILVSNLNWMLGKNEGTYLLFGTRPYVT
jgi:hypothetical protein